MRTTVTMRPRAGRAFDVAVTSNASDVTDPDALAEGRVVAVTSPDGTATVVAIDRGLRPLPWDAPDFLARMATAPTDGDRMAEPDAAIVAVSGLSAEAARRAGWTAAPTVTLIPRWRMAGPAGWPVHGGGRWEPAGWSSVPADAPEWELCDAARNDARAAVRAAAIAELQRRGIASGAV